jgi:phosphoglucomutase
MLEMRDIMNEFRQMNKTFGDSRILSEKDYAKGIDGLPKSNVLKFFLENDCSIVIRPSGTEPKLKVYFTVTSEGFSEAYKVERKFTNYIDSIIENN